MLTCLCLVGQLPITQHLSMPRVFMSAYLALLDRVGQYHTARGAHTNRNTLWPKFEKQSSFNKSSCGYQQPQLFSGY